MPLMKMKAYANFDKYLADQKPGHRTIIRALRRFVKQTAPEVSEAVKWGNGCWVMGKAFVAYVYAGDPGYVQFGFVQGSKLEDPKGLLEGQAKYVRHIKVYKASDIAPRAYAALLRQAVDRA